MDKSKRIKYVITTKDPDHIEIKKQKETLTFYKNGARVAWLNIRTGLYGGDERESVRDALAVEASTYLYPNDKYLKQAREIKKELPSTHYLLGGRRW